MKKKKLIPKKVRLWVCQTSHSGNANGHFELVELPVNSKEKDVIEHWKPYCFCVYNVKNLGIFTSDIGNRDFPTESFLKKFPTLE